MSVSIDEALSLLSDKKYYLHLYSECYGSARGLSDEGERLFREQVDEPDVDYQIYKVTILKLLRKHGSDKIANQYGSLSFMLVDIKYKGWVSNSEYDGLETPEFRGDKFVKDKVHQYFRTNSSLDRKDYENFLEEEMDFKWMNIRIPN